MEADKNKRASGQRPRKRKGKFQGNQYTRYTKASRLETASARKIDLDVDNLDSNFPGFIIIDQALVLKELEKCLSCKVCHGNIKINCTKLFGLSSKFTVMCSNCSDVSSFKNSKMLGAKKNVSELNRRFIYAMRCIGQGHAGMKTFAAVMDLPSPVSQKAYDATVTQILCATSKVCKSSMQKATEEEVRLTESSDISVSGDGTWKTRGYSSLIGVCTLIGGESGKVVDTQVMSSFCKGCLEWNEDRSGPAYEAWLADHKTKCVKNHIGSSGMMEVNGMIEIFKRSEEKYNTRYATYLGDGDCKTFSAIQKSKPYKELSLCKLECIGHVKKRMGSHLRKLKVSMRGKKLCDNKSLCGKGRLTDSMINQLTSYYGNAIRKHSDSVRNMQSAVWAIWHHKASTDENPMHQFCPKGEDSWCDYVKAATKGCAKNYKHKNTLPTPVMEAIKGIFKELSHPDLLRKCLGGKTQNVNESLNALIWKICPKSSGASRRIAVNEATIDFNDGWKGRLQVMEVLGLCPGTNAQLAALAADEKRISESKSRAVQNPFDVRAMKQQVEKQTEKSMRMQEGKVYAAGEF